MSILPFDDRDGVIWFNCKMGPWRNAQTHVMTQGLHYGSCVFEGERVYGGHFFKLREHTERLFHSARVMGFEIPFSQDEIDAACKEVVVAQNIENGYLRPVTWRGSELLAVSAQQTRIHVAIVCASVSCPDLRREAYSAGKLNEQLDDQMEKFLRSREKGMKLDERKNRVYLSAIFKWFAEDFESRGGVLKYIGQYVPAEERKVLNNSKIKISYLYYNWKINH